MTRHPHDHDDGPTIASIMAGVARAGDPFREAGCTVHPGGPAGSGANGGPVSRDAPRYPVSGGGYSAQTAGAPAPVRLDVDGLAVEFGEGEEARAIAFARAHKARRIVYVPKPHGTVSPLWRVILPA